MSTTTAASSNQNVKDVEEEEKEVQTNQYEDEEPTPQDPKLRFFELRHLLNQFDASYSQEDVIVSKDEIQGLLTELRELVKQHNMLHFYLNLKPQLRKAGSDIDQALVAELKQAIADEATATEKKIEDAKANAGDTEVYDAKIAHAHYVANTGDKAAALELYEDCLKNAVGGTARIDVAMAIVRLAFAHEDLELLGTWIQKAHNMVEKEGDWERRNRLNVYRAMYYILSKDFASAAKLLVDAVATFTATELLSFDNLIILTVLISMITLPRVELRDKVVKSPDIIQAIRDVPHLREFLHALYDCRYKDFFVELLPIAVLAQRSPYLAPHKEVFLREVRLVAYLQFLASYQSVTIASMAQLFGVSTQFIDSELARFIASGRLPCKIDGVNGVVVMMRPGTRDALYQQLIKEGDEVLNRVQKLTQKLKSA